MIKKKVLITGINGMLGSKIALQLSKKYEIIGLGRTKSSIYPTLSVDLYDSDSIQNIEEKNIDIVIHTAANVNLRDCELHPDRAQQIHVNATAELTKKFTDALFIYISTDSVFDGENGNYNEESNPNPLNVYAQSKLDGEKPVKENCNRYYILRSNIYGVKEPMGGSLFEWGYQSLLQNNSISGFENMLFNPLSVNQLATLIEQIILDSIPYGTYNTGCREVLSKYDFLISIADVFNFDKKLISPIIYTNQGQDIQRPIDTTLDVQLLNSFISLENYTIENGLKEIKENLAL